MGVSAFEYVERVYYYFTTFCTGLSLSVQLSADSTQVCRPVRSRHSAVRSPQRWASAVALAGGRCFTRGSIQITVSASFTLLYAYFTRYGTRTRLFTLPCLNTACASLSTRSTRRRTISTSAPGTTRDTHTRRFLGLRYALVFAARGVGWHATWDTCPRACCAGAAKVPLAGAPERLSEGRWGGPLAGHMAGQASCTACLHACAPRVEGEMEIFKSRNQLQSATRGSKVTMSL
jgi:hypothetical protein